MPTPSPHLWPASLLQSARPPKLVYLDLLHWIALAQANTGHVEGAKVADVLLACVTAVESGAAVFPISDSLYIEVARIGLQRQRRDLREIIERVSGFTVVASREVIAAHELEALLDTL